MNKKEAIELLRESWFVSLSGNHTQNEVENALKLAEKCYEEAAPYKAKARALKARAKALEAENAALRVELVKQARALKAIFADLTIAQLPYEPTVTLTSFVPRDEYEKSVLPLKGDKRYTEAPQGEGEEK